MYIDSVFHRKIVLLRESEKCSSRGLFILFLLRNILYVCYFYHETVIFVIFLWDMRKDISNRLTLLTLVTEKFMLINRVIFVLFDFLFDILTIKAIEMIDLYLLIEEE